MNIIGFWEVVTTDGTYYSDRFEGETIKQALADARATFGRDEVVQVIKH